MAETRLASQLNADGRKWLEAAKVFAARFRTNRGFPVGRDEIKERVREQGLASLEDRQSPQEALVEDEGAEAMAAAINYLLEQDPDTEPSLMTVASGSENVRRTCGLVTFTFGKLFDDTQFMALHESGQLAEEVGRKCAQDDVADFLDAWAQLDACKLLSSLTQAQMTRLETNTKWLFTEEARESGLLEAREKARAEAAERRSDVRALVRIANLHEDAMQRMNADDRQLLEFFTYQLFEQPHRKRGRLAEALRLELEATFEQLEEEDLSPLIETIVHAKPDVSWSEIRSPKRMARLLITLVLPACVLFPGGFNKLLHPNRAAGKPLDLAGIEQQYLDELPEGARNRVRRLLFGSATERSCWMLQMTSEHDLEQIFQPLFLSLCAGPLSCPKPELFKRVEELKKIVKQSSSAATRFLFSIPAWWAALTGR